MTTGIRAACHGCRKRFEQQPVAGCLALLGLISLWALLTVSPTMGGSGDNAMYVLHARNLVAGLPYDLTGYIQNPDSFMAPVTYPPGYPLLLAPGYALFGLNVLALNTLSTLYFLLAAAVFVWHARGVLVREPRPTFALLAVVLLFALNPKSLDLSHSLLSDTVFLLPLLVSVVLIDAAFASWRQARPRPAWIGLAVGAGLAIAFATSVRVFGLVLIPSLLLFDLRRHRALSMPMLIMVAVALVACGLTSAWTDHLSAGVDIGGDRGYLDLIREDLYQRLAETPLIMAQTAAGYIVAAPLLFDVSLDMEIIESLTEIVTPMILLLALAGLIRQFRRGASSAEFFVVLYVLALLPWQVVYSRYLLPLLPFLLIYFIIGLGLCTARLRPWAARSLVGFFVVVLCLPYLIHIGARSGPQTIAADAPNGEQARRLYRVIDTELPRDTTVLYRKPRLLTLFTSVRSASYADNFNAPPTPEAFLQLMQRLDAHYVLAGPHRRADDPVDRLIQAYPERFEALYIDPDHALYRYRPAANSGSNAAGEDPVTP